MLAYGSEVYQLPMPSRSRDAHIAGKPITSHLFPSPGTDDWETYGPPVVSPVDLNGTTVVRDEFVSISMKFEQVQKVQIEPEAHGEHTDRI